MRKRWFSRYQVSTVSNLAEVLVRCTGHLQGKEWANYIRSLDCQ